MHLAELPGGSVDCEVCRVLLDANKSTDDYELAGIAYRPRLRRGDQDRRGKSSDSRSSTSCVWVKVSLPLVNMLLRLDSSPGGIKAVSWCANKGRNEYLLTRRFMLGEVARD